MRIAINLQPPISNPVPIAWTIAGSDSGGGAGIQADLKVMNAFGVHGCSAITAITAQNTLGVQSLEPVSPTMLRAQLQALEDDLFPSAIKTGMLGNAESCEIIADFLERYGMRDAGCGKGSSGSTVKPLLVCDPILKSTSGSNLLDPEARDILIQGVFPNVDVLTPNLPEVKTLVGQGFQTVEAAAERVLEMGVGSVLIKGGHAEGGECRDYWTDGRQSMWLSSPRIETAATHGTGCILSSAIASAIALGQEIPKAIVIAKTFLNQCLKTPANLGAGHGPMMIEPFRDDPQDRPDVVVGGGGDLSIIRKFSTHHFNPT
ncbi:MAG: bifunctional hydroxymethylpyrimidine kinase/phosphomethylpyrimidine kinase [Verrucomicrobiota bacterium]